jgi:hypothetical protein
VPQNFLVPVADLGPRLFAQNCGYGACESWTDSTPAQCIATDLALKSWEILV